MVIACLFDACSWINRAADGLITLSAADIESLRSLFNTFLVDLLGVRVDNGAAEDDNRRTKSLEGAVDLLMDIRKNAKEAKDWTTSDFIRDRLAALGFTVKDTKTGVEWNIK